MNEKLNKNTKVEQLTNMFLSRGEEKGLTVKDPLEVLNTIIFVSLKTGTGSIRGYFILK